MAARSARSARSTRRAPRLVAVAVCVLGAAVAVSACSWTKNDTLAATYGLPDLEQSLMAHEWVLDADDSSIPSSGSNPVTLAFGDGGVVSGVGPCNLYRGTFTIDDDELSIDPGAATRRACEPAVMEAEDAYFDALAQVRSVDATDRDRLVLKRGDTRLAYDAFDVDEEIVGGWQILSVASGDAVTSVLAGTDPTLSLSKDRTLVVDTGCNGIRTEWTLDGTNLTFDAPAQTLMACDPPELMDQETAIAAALIATRQVDLAPGSLTLLDGDGRIVLTASRA